MEANWPRLLVLTALLLAALPQPTSAQSTRSGRLEIMRISPSGTNVPPGRQIVIEFDRPVVPLGRMQRESFEVPVTIVPALACQWRWLDPAALACELDADAAMQPATRYRLEIGTALTAVDGARLGAAREHTFETQRPSAEHAYFSTWRGPGTPVIGVVFNVAVTASSVTDHLRVETPPRSFELSVEPDPQDRELPRFLPLPGERAFVDFGATQADSPDDRRVDAPPADEARRIWLVSPREPLPADTRARLTVEPGLRSPAGPELGDQADVVVEFDTFPAYRFLGVVCRSNGNEPLRVPAAGAPRGAPCNPQLPVGLEFSAPTIEAEVRDHVTIAAAPAGERTDYDPWATTGPGYSRLRAPHRRGQTYVVWLPERLHAAAVYRLSSERDAGPRDEFGRALSRRIELEIATDHRPPNYEIVHSQAVIESQIDSDVPLFVTNLDAARLDYRRLTPAGRVLGLARDLPLPTIEDLQVGVPLGVRVMLGASSGALYGRVTTSPPVPKREWQRTIFAQVTPYQLHVKLGHFNTLVWVTDLATGAPVRGATVSIYVDRIAELAADQPPLDRATTDRDGIALLAGTETLDPPLELLGYGCRARNPDLCPRLFVRVERGGELALLPLDRRFELSAFRVSNYTVFARNEPRFGHLRSWGATAQGVYRAGDAIDFKIYVRDQSNETLVAAPSGPYRLEIVDPTGTTVHTIGDLELSRFGGFAGRFVVPESGAIGWYQFVLTALFDGAAELTRVPLRVLVTDFNPAAFRVVTSINGDTVAAGAAVATETRASLFSGGPYGNAEARITATLVRRSFTSDHPLAAGFRFDSVDMPQSLTIERHAARVDASGALDHRFAIADDIGEQIVHGVLSIESAVRDDRGRDVANTASARFLAVDRLVGLRNSRWIYREGEPAAIDVLVVGADGAPVAEVPVHVEIERLATRAARVQGAGNAYLTQFVDDWVDVERCEARSSTTPTACAFVPPAPGRYRILAQIRDSRGRPHAVAIGAWAAGRGQVVWNSSDDDALQIVPERTRYATGEIARYLIQNPYPGARALVTLERYGVLRQWVETLETGTPVIEFEIEPELVPGFFLSVLVMSPRVAAPPPTPGELDLGKPTFKLGLLQVPVVDPYRRIDVDVHVDADVHRPRDRVRIEIEARAVNRDGAAPIECAVVVLDEAIVDLLQGGAAYFDPLAGFDGIDGLDVRNYGLLTRLVGRQGLESKGATPGGDGGAALSMRSLLEHVAYWNPSLELGRNGRGALEFELPDTLTGWRVLVIALTPTDRMGLGQGSFVTNLPTELRPVMPNQVTEGDRFDAGFNVLNRTDRPRELTVEIVATGDVAAPVSHSTRLSLAAFGRTTIEVPVEAARIAIDRNTGSGRIVFEARAFDADDGDALHHELTVHKARLLQTAASYGSITGAAVAEAVHVPETIYSDVGEIGVDLSPSVIGNLEGAFRHAQNVDPVGWEQRLTAAVMAAHFGALESHVNDAFAWPASRTLAAATLELAANYQSPNGGMSFFVPRDEYVSPYLSAYTALAFNWLRQAGEHVPETVEARLHTYLDTLLRRSVFPEFYSRGMASSVRAVALAALAEHGKVETADLVRYRDAVEQMSLFGKAHFVLAAQRVDGGQALAREVLEIVRRSAVRSAGKLSFNEVLDDGYLRVLATPMRANCAVLAALVALGADDDADGLFELVRTITESRHNREHWENSQENVFCTRALIDYARRYETDVPRLEAEVKLDAATLGRATLLGFDRDAVSVVRPLDERDPGRSARIEIARRGVGRLYYAARVSYAELAQPSARINAGIDVRRESSVRRNGAWVLLGQHDPIVRGEVVRVDLFVSLPTARHFVVVDDPLPGALEPINRDLANASTVDADAGAFAAAGGSWWFQFSDWLTYGVSRWSFHHVEMRHDSVRFYSDYLPPGHYHLSYTAQAIAEGEFRWLATRAAETYDPDVFGSDLDGTLIVAAP